MHRASTDFRRPRQRARRFTGSAGAALVLSAIAHAVAAVTIGAALRAASRGGDALPEVVQVEVAAASVVPVASSDSIPSPFGPATQAGEVSPSPRRARATRARTPIAVATASPAFEAGDAPVARFVMTAGTVATRAEPGSPGPSTAAPAGNLGGADYVAGEGEVDAPARLLRTSPLVYPQAARQGAIEIDFPVEIIVDTDGRVVSARALRHAGYGLDEAAIRAIRDYRFSPAIRLGRPVRVRMRWTVQFRLR